MSLLVAAMWVWGATALAGPWVREPGEAYGKAGVARFESVAAVDASGVVRDDVPTLVHAWYLYAEAGVLPRVAVTANVPFVAARNTWDGTPYVNRSGGDAEAGVTVAVFRGRVPVSFAMNGKIPMYDNADLLQYGMAGMFFPVLGDGQVDLTAVAAAGVAFGSRWTAGWVSAEAGWRHRTEWWVGDSSRPDREFADGVPFRAQLGYQPPTRLQWLAVEVGGIRDGSDSPETRELVQIAAAASVSVAGGIAVEAFGAAIPWARAAATGSSLGLGVSYRRAPSPTGSADSAP